MFDPLKELLSLHGAKLENRLAGVEWLLKELVEHTASAVAADEYAWLNGTSETDSEKGAEVRIENTEKVGWEVQQTAVTGSEEGDCAVYVGNIAPQNLVDAVKTPLGISTANYYIAPQTSLIFHFFEQEAEKEQCTVNVQVKRMLVRADILTVSGREWEGTDGDLRVPAGHPLRGSEGHPLDNDEVHNPPSVEIPSM